MYLHLKYCTYFIYLWPWDYIRMTFRKIDSGPLCVYKWSRLHYLPKIESCILEKMLNNKCCHFKKTSEAFCWLQCGRIGTRTQEWMKTRCFWNSCLTIFSIHFLKSAVSFITPRLKEEKKIPRSVILITEERQKLFLFFEINFYWRIIALQPCVRKFFLLHTFSTLFV